MRPVPSLALGIIRGMHIIQTGPARVGVEVPITEMAQISWLQTLATIPTHLPCGQRSRERFLTPGLQSLDEAMLEAIAAGPLLRR